MDVWLPYRHSMGVEGMEVRGLTNVMVVGRLAPGSSLQQADDEVGAVSAALAEAYPELRNDEILRVVGAQEAIHGSSRSSLGLLYAAVSLVLLIAGTNVAHLLLGRNSARGREIAVRMALGAGRARVIRQVLAESTLLALGGAAVGCGVGWGMLRAMTAGELLAMPGVSPALDLRVLGATTLLALLAGLLLGALPAWHISRQAPQETLRLTGPTASKQGRLARRSLAVAELAIAVVLLFGASLTLQSMNRLLQVDPGFNPASTITASLALPMGFVSGDWPQAVSFFEELTERLRATPGVETATAAFQLPVEPGWNNSFELLDGREPPEGQNDIYARFRPVLPGYFEAAGIPLLRGRTIQPTDRSDAPGVVVVNEAFARFFFRDDDPIGAQIGCSNWWRAFEGNCEIVGVVADVRTDGRAEPSPPTTYFAHAQQPVREMKMLLRTRGAAAGVVEALRAEVARLDPSLPVDRVTTLEEALGAREASRRSIVQLLGAFAALALTLAGIGIYGVMSFLVTRRTREIGIRMALGARAQQLRRMVLGEGMLLVGLGLALGVAAAATLSGYLESQLYGVGRHDPTAFAIAALFLVVVALLACWIPAMRATRVDPTRPLRAS